jgi:hypothetical protein
MLLLTALSPVLASPMFSRLFGFNNPSEPTGKSLSETAVGDADVFDEWQDAGAVWQDHLHEQDCAVVEDIFQQLQYVPSGDVARRGGDCCDLPEVKCSSEGRVSKLKVTSRAVTKPTVLFPEALHQLVKLDTLYMKSYSGSWKGSTLKTVFLNPSRNYLNLLCCTLILFRIFSHCTFGATLQEMDVLGLPSLQFLAMSDCGFTGTFPSWAYNLLNLKSLYCILT